MPGQFLAEGPVLPVRTGRFGDLASRPENASAHTVRQWVARPEKTVRMYFDFLSAQNGEIL
jgi:hypothetical protein